MRHEVVVHANANDQREHTEYKRIDGCDELKVLHDGFSSYRMTSLRSESFPALIRRKYPSCLHIAFGEAVPTVSSGLQHTIILAELIAHSQR